MIRGIRRGKGESVKSLTLNISETNRRCILNKCCAQILNLTPAASCLKELTWCLQILVFLRKAGVSPETHQILSLLTLLGPKASKLGLSWNLIKAVVT
jgi:hypothetical protein